MSFPKEGQRTSLLIPPVLPRGSAPGSTPPPLSRELRPRLKRGPQGGCEIERCFYLAANWRNLAFHGRGTRRARLEWGTASHWMRRERRVPTGIVLGSRQQRAVLPRVTEIPAVELRKPKNRSLGFGNHDCGRLIRDALDAPGTGSAPARVPVTLARTPLDCGGGIVGGRSDTASPATIGVARPRPWWDVLSRTNVYRAHRESGTPRLGQEVCLQ